jgi:nitrate reductase gamma subunit
MYGTETICNVLTYAAIAILCIVMIYRTVSIWRMPVHLRWELAPVPGEKGRGTYGGSYLEEYEWWTKKREKSLVNELLYMLKEIFLLKSVWENNRILWFFSLPFHWGLYLLIFLALLLCAEALLGLGLNYPILFLAYAGYIAGVFGSVCLLFKRTIDLNLRSYSTYANYFNLVFLIALHASGLYALISYERYAYHMSRYIHSILNFSLNIALPPALSLHVIIVMLFIIYMPFTQMIHFVAKYFTYHSIKWNDMPMNDKMAKAISTLLGQPVSWSAPHIQGDGQKNWINVAQQDMKNEKSDKVK